MQLFQTTEEFFSICVTFFECCNNVISQTGLNKVLSNLCSSENKESAEGDSAAEGFLWREGGRFNLYPLMLPEVCVCRETGLILCDINSEVYRYDWRGRFFSWGLLAARLHTANGGRRNCTRDEEEEEDRK